MSSSSITHEQIFTRIVHFTIPVTKKNIIKLCLDLSETFNVLYGTSSLEEKYRFEPLDRCEGGIEMISWPGKLEPMHKSFRFPFMMKWPRINGDEMEKWKNDATIIVEKWTKKPYSLICDLHFHALQDAPLWTDLELAIVEKTMNKIGINFNKNRSYLLEVKK